MAFRSAIFDVDGVLVDSPHESAWREGQEQLMEKKYDVRPRASYSPERSTPGVYQRVMSGKPRYAGAQAVCSSTSICPTPRSGHGSTGTASR